MKRTTLVLAVLLLFLTASPLRAADFSPYAEIKAGGECRQFDDIRNSSQVAVPAPANKTHADDIVGVVGGAVGLDFKNLGVPMRAELEYAYHSSMSYSANPTFINAAVPTSLKSDVDSSTLFLNVYYDFDTGTAFRPYVGGGVGRAWNHSDATSTVLDTGRTKTMKTTKGNFAWNIGAGCSYALTANWIVEAGYRYVDFGKMVWGDSECQLSSKEVTGHEMTLGLRYQF